MPILIKQWLAKRADTIERYFKIFLQLITVELALALAAVFLLQNIPHRDVGISYLTNQNAWFLLAVFTWINYFKSTNNRKLIAIFGSWSSAIALLSFSANFITEENLANYEVWENLAFKLGNLIIAIFGLFIALYLILYVIYGNKQSTRTLLFASGLTMLASVIILIPMVQSPHELEYNQVFEFLPYFYILAFASLVVFWQQYAKFHLVLSEHLTTVLTVFSIMIANEIFQDFSYKNDLIFYSLGLYFNLILSFTMLIVWLVRLEYLNSPLAKENEYYIENYNLVPGDMEKPRQGASTTIYFNKKNRAYVYGVLGLLLILGLSLFLFNHFEVFIKLNILILIIALVASVIWAFVYWHRRWYNSIGFLFKKRK